MIWPNDKSSVWMQNITRIRYTLPELFVVSIISDILQIKRIQIKSKKIEKFYFRSITFT